MNTIGSTIKMDGFYETSNPKRPSVDMDISILDMDFQKAFVTFNTIKKIAPIAEKMVGRFSTTFKMQTPLDQQLNPIYDSLYAIGSLNIPQAGFHDVKLFNKAAEALKYSNLSDPTLKNVTIRFEVKNGRVTTEPFDMNVAGQKLTLSGYTGFDQTIHYTGKVGIPRSALGAGNTAINGLLAQANAAAGTNVKMNDIINVNLGLEGTFSNPKVTTNLSDIAKNEANSVKDQLKNELDKKRKEIEDKARAEADKAKKEAEAKIKAETDKVKAEADRLKKEAEAKAKAEADKAKKQAEEEAKKKLKGMFGK
jgi:F0F1-type ATP synthase membrane subunit b/b'